MTGIRLLLAEVEGTLLTSDGALTPATERAVACLRDAGIALAITSGRAPRAMRTLIEALAITTPVSAFDGGMLVRTDLSVLEQHVLDDAVARAIVAAMERHGLDVWVYQDDAWLVRRPNTIRAEREQTALQFAPEAVDRWDDRVHDAIEITGSSDDVDALARCEAELHTHRAYVAVVRSPLCSVVARHPRANTSELVRTLARRLGIPAESVATIGHALKDIVMFRESGVAIAMGQASAAVQRSARYITPSNDNEGFAYAVQTWLLKFAAGEARASAG